MKDTISNVVAIILVIAGAVNAYLQSNVGEVDYFQLGLAVLGAIVAFLTGKSQNLNEKSK